MCSKLDKLDKLIEIAKTNNYDLIDDNCDIQELLYHVCHNDNVEMLKYLIENYKEKINITPSFIADWYINIFENYNGEMFDILIKYDVNDEAINEIIYEANEKIEDGKFMLSEMEKLKKSKI